MPQSAAELTSLRTLELLVVGPREDPSSFQLSGLGQLKRLKGKISIEHLERVRDVKEAEKAKLQEKHDLLKLNLAWDSDEEDGAGAGHAGDYDEQEEINILEALQPPPRLRALSLSGYKGTCQIPWRLPSLERLELRALPSMKFVFASSQKSNLEGSFPFASLKYLRLENLRRLENIFSGEEEEEEEDDVSPKNFPTFPLLSELRIENCDELKSFGSGPFPSLRSVEFTGSDTVMLSMLTSTSHSSRSLFRLEKLKISEFSLESFPEEIFRGLSSLRELIISSGSYLKSLPESIQRLPSLSKLEIAMCPQLEHVSDIIFHSTSLEHLVLSDLSSASLNSSSPDSMDPPKLKNLELKRLPSLMSLPNWMPQLVSLRELKIRECPQLSKRCVKDIGADWDKVAHIPNIVCLNY